MLLGLKMMTIESKVRAVLMVRSGNVSVGARPGLGEGQNRRKWCCCLGRPLAAVESIRDAGS